MSSKMIQMLELNLERAIINMFKYSKGKMVIINEQKESKQRNGNCKRESNGNSQARKYNDK